LSRSPILPIFLIVLVDILGLTMLLPLLPFYAKTFGATAGQVGALLAVYSLFSLVCGPPLGALSDRFGRKPVLLASQVGTFLGLLLMASATSLWMLFAARIIDGATAGNITVAQAYIADVSKPSQRAKSFGFLGVAFGVGFLIGPAATAFVASHFGDRTAVFVAAGLSLTSLIATLILLPAKPPKPAPEPGEIESDAAPEPRRISPFDFRAFADYFRRPSLSPLLWQFLASQLSFGLFFGGFALYAERRFAMSTAGVSYSFAYAGLLGIFVQGYLLHRLMGTLGESRLLVIGFLAQIVSQCTLALAGSIPMVYAGITALAFTGFLRPVISSLLSRRTSPHEQGAVMGVTQSLSSVSQIVGPLLAGFLIGRDWLVAWGLIGATIAVIGLALQRSSKASFYATASSGA
jgi:MFS transporter, DHA1 family, tetracycline resistance protein